MVKGFKLIKIQGKFCARNLKDKHRYKNVIECEDTLMHKAERPSIILSNTFTHNQTEQMK